MGIPMLLPTRWMRRLSSPWQQGSRGEMRRGRRQLGLPRVQQLNQQQGQERRRQQQQRSWMLRCRTQGHRRRDWQPTWMPPKVQGREPGGKLQWRGQLTLGRLGPWEAPAACYRTWFQTRGQTASAPWLELHGQGFRLGQVSGRSRGPELIQGRMQQRQRRQRRRQQRRQPVVQRQQALPFELG